MRGRWLFQSLASVCVGSIYLNFLCLCIVVVGLLNGNLSIKKVDDSVGALRIGRGMCYHYNSCSLLDPLQAAP